MSGLPDPSEHGDRAVSAVVGFILIFGILVITLSVYQAEVVPQQNSEVEFEQYQGVQQQMVELRSQIVSMQGSASTRSTTVDLGVRYPSRTIFVNPGPARGSLRTVGTSDGGINLTVQNVTAVDNTETGDFWNGTALTYNTGIIEYTPDYNQFQGGLPVVYEHSLIYNRVSGGNSVPLTDQSLVDDNRVSLIALNGTLTQSSVGTTSVDLDPVSTRTRVVDVNNKTGPITLEFASRLNASVWEDTFEDQLVSNGGHVQNVSSLRDRPDEFSILKLTLEPDQRYELKLSKVGIGTGATGTDAEYLTDVVGAGATVQVGSNQTLTVEARDRFNGPQSGLTVNASAEGGTFAAGGDKTEATTNADGQATFLYEPNSTASSGDPHQINFTIEPGYRPTPNGNHNTSTPVNVTMEVTATPPNNGTSGTGNGSGGFSVAWKKNELESSYPDAVTSQPGGRYRYNVSKAETLVLNMSTIPPVDGAQVNYAVTNRSLANLTRYTGQTDSNGDNSTTLRPKENGTITVYTYSGGDADELRLNITNVNSGVQPTSNLSSTTVTDIVPNANSQQQTFTFTLENSISSGDNVTITVVNPPGQNTLAYGDSAVDDEGAGGDASINQNGDTTITYRPGSTTPAGTTVEIRAGDMTVGPESNHNDPYDVTFERSDTDGVETLTFDISRNTGNANLTNVSVETITGNSTTQEITFEPTTDMSSIGGTNERVGIDLSDGASLYSNAGVRAVTSGSASLNTDGGSAWVVYTIPDTNISAGTPVTITLKDVEPTTTGQSYEVGFSRGSADTTNTTFSVIDQFASSGTIAYTGLETVDGDNGTRTGFSPSGIQALGPPGEDLNNDGSPDMPYLKSGDLRILGSGGNTETLVSKQDVNAARPRTSKTLLATGTWNGSAPSVFYANKNEDKLYRVNASGSPVEVASPGDGTNAVMGTGDIDGDQADELLFADDSQSIQYVDDDGTIKNLDGADAGSSTGIGAGQLPTYNDKDWALTVNGSNSIELTTANTSSTGTKTEGVKPGELSGNDKGAAKVPLTAADVDNDGKTEIVYVEAGDNEIRYINNPLSNNPTKRYMKDKDGNKISAGGSIGVVSSVSQ